METLSSSAQQLLDVHGCRDSSFLTSSIRQWGVSQKPIGAMGDFWHSYKERPSSSALEPLRAVGPSTLPSSSQQPTCESVQVTSLLNGIQPRL